MEDQSIRTRTFRVDSDIDIDPFSNIDIEISYDFSKYGSTIVIGACYWIQNKAGRCEPKKLIEGEGTLSGVHRILSKCTGLYTIITKVDEGICLATDIVNTYPLCYTSHNGTLYVSDDNRYILDNIGSVRIEKTSYLEYKHATYVSGDKTLIKGVRQTEGGKTKAISSEGDVFEKRQAIDFANNRWREPSDITDVAMTAVERLAKYASGRPIWLALSGGYDSRILAVMIKRVGYSDVNTYTYGLPGNVEVDRARQTARALSFDWEFVELTPTIWQNVYSSEIRQEMDSRNWIRTSLPIADWPAVHKLKMKGKISKGSVIVTGHGGGFLAGAIYPNRMYSKEFVSKNKIINTIIRQHYNKNDIEQIEAENIKQKLRERINYSGGRGEVAVSYLDRWYLYEYQTKHIASTLQAYEYEDINYWVPFFDKEYVKLWSDTSMEQRNYKRLYRRFIDQNVKNENVLIETEKLLNQEGNSSMADSFKRLVTEVGIRDVLADCYNVWKKFSGQLREEYDGEYAEPRGSLTAMDYNKFKEVYNGDTWLSSYRAREILGEIELTE